MLRPVLVPLTPGWVSEHGEERLQRVKIKFGKLQALDALVRQLGALVAKAAQEAARKDDDLWKDIAAGRLRLLDQQAEQLRARELELAETRAALAAAQARLGAAGRDTSSSPPANQPPSVPHEPEPPDQPMPRPPARVPVWPEPGAPLPARGTPEHTILLRQLRRGELSSGIAVQLLMSE